MSDKPVQPFQTVMPGLIIDANHAWHFFPDDFLRGHGLPVTPENREIATEALKDVMRQQHPKTTLVEVFDKASYQP